MLHGLLELAGIPKPDSFQGNSFAKLLADPNAVIRKYAFAEHNWHDYQAYERGVRSERFTYIYNALPKLNASPPADAVRSPTYRAMQELYEQDKLALHQLDCFTVPVAEHKLFDLEEDPYSLTNLAGDGAYANVLAEMKAAEPDPDFMGRESDDFDAESVTVAASPGSAAMASQATATFFLNEARKSRQVFPEGERDDLIYSAELLYTGKGDWIYEQVYVFTPRVRASESP